MQKSRIARLLWAEVSSGITPEEATLQKKQHRAAKRLTRTITRRKGQ